MARLDVSTTRTVFLTLTFAGIPTPEHAKKCFKRFTMRIRRKYPNSSAIWRMEAQKRGSPHFHLIAFNMPYVRQRRLQRMWTQCTREARSIVHVKLLRGGKRQAMSYVSKYLAKVRDGSGSYLDNAAYQHDEREFEGDPGRYWGYLNRQQLPFAALEFIDFDDFTVFADLWFMMLDATNGRIGSYRHNMRCYSDQTYELSAYVRRVASCLLIDVTHADGSKFKLSEATFI